MADQQALLEGALWWADRGVPVFPTSKTKAPLTENGHLDASTDPDEIRFMFEGTNAHGVGAAMGKEAGLFAIDADYYKEGEAGIAAQEFIDGLKSQGLLINTRTHKTVSGGAHFLFSSDTAWPNCKPSKGVEVKGEGGYIIVPPTAGYEVLDKGLSLAPAELIDLLETARIARQSHGVDKLKEDILSGDDFHDSLTSLAAKRSADGRPIEEVQAELLQVLSASQAMVPTHPRHARWRALVEDKSGEFTRIVQSANRKFNVSQASADLVELFGERFGSTAPAPYEDMAASERPVKSVEDYGGEWPFADSRGYFGHEELNVLEQRFVMFPILSEREVTLISAQPKAGKTLVSQTIAMHIASGRDLGGLQVHEQRPVLYYALESQVAIKKRTAAWKMQQTEFKNPVDEDAFKMYVNEAPVNLLDEKTREDFVNKIKAAEQWFIDRGTEPLGAIVIDTLTKAMPMGDQNSVEDTSAVFNVIDMIKDAGIVAPVVIIHHNTKNGEQPRGSSNIQAEPDTLLTVKQDADTNVLTLSVVMARSIDDTLEYHFQPVTKHLGITEQGYEITAPVLLPSEGPDAVAADEATESLLASVDPNLRDKIDKVVEEGEDRRKRRFAKERAPSINHNLSVLDALAEFGIGTWSRVKIAEYLRDVCGPEYDEVRKLRPNSEKWALFMGSIVPREGGITHNGVHITMIWEYNRMGRLIAGRFTMTE